LAARLGLQARPTSPTYGCEGEFQAGFPCKMVEVGGIEPPSKQDTIRIEPPSKQASIIWYSLVEFQDTPSPIEPPDQGECTAPSKVGRGMSNLNFL